MPYLKKMGCASLERIGLAQCVIIRGAVAKLRNQKRPCNVRSGNFLD
jgi:hypothetical protein